MGDDVDDITLVKQNGASQADFFDDGLISILAISGRAAVTPGEVPAPASLALFGARVRHRTASSHRLIRDA